VAFGVALLPQAVPVRSMTSVAALSPLVLDLGVPPLPVAGLLYGLELEVGVTLGVGDPVLLIVGVGVAVGLDVGPGVLLALGVGVQVAAPVAVFFPDFVVACWPGCTAAGGGCHSFGVARPATAGGC
jgi:hypothetical protein